MRTTQATCRERRPIIAPSRCACATRGSPSGTSLDLGAWEMPTRASAMELNIPGIHGVGDSLIYFVDRYQRLLHLRRRLRAARRHRPEPPALAGLHWFGVVQTICADRTRRLDRFLRRPASASACCRDGQYFGVLPKGTLLESPCHKFYLQLIEPPPGAEDIDWDEGLVRVGLGAPDVPAAVRALQERGIVFVDRGAVQPSDKGALTQVYLGGVTFELVVSHARNEHSTTSAWTRSRWRGRWRPSCARCARRASRRSC